MVHTLTLEAIRKAKAKHQAAIADLEAAERVMLSGIDLDSRQPALVPPANGAHRQVRNAASHSGQPPKKWTMLKVIADAPSGLTTREVIEAVTRAGVANKNMANTSPQLSGLKKAKRISLHGNVWRIAESGREYLNSYKDVGGQP